MLFGGSDSACLIFLETAAKQNHQRFTVSSEIDPITRAVGEATLAYSPAHRFYVSRIAGFHSCDCGSNFQGSGCLELSEPL